MRLILTACFSLLALPAMADIDRVIDEHIITRQAAFAESTAALVDAARLDCTPAGVIPAYHTAFDAWVGVSHIRFGPLASSGEMLAVAYWPDKKGHTPKALARLIRAEDPIVHDPDAFASYSVAGRGFFALERMLFDEAFFDYQLGSYSCALTQAIAGDLARIAAETHAGWTGSFATILRSAGAEGNEVFLTDKEGAQALFTNMLVGLEFIYTQRIGRPLGSFERPRPKWAEARRSGRSLHNIVVSLEALQEMAEILADDQAPETMEMFATTLRFAQDLDDQVFNNLDQTSAKFQLGSLREMVMVLHQVANAEIGTHMGVVAGFNALDGD